MRLVVDASPLILLASCGQLTLLDRLAESVSVPGTVLEEIAAGSDLEQTAAEVQRSPWISIVEPSRSSEALSVSDLGAGETAVLGWAEAERSRRGDR